MAKENRCRYAVLGMLHYGDMTGYEIRKRLQEIVGYFWQEASASVYPALKALEKDKLIEANREIQETGPLRIRYKISKKGREIFKLWINQEPTPTAIRNEFALKLVFGNLTDQAYILKYIQKEAEATKTLMQNLEVIIKTLPKEENSLMWNLVADYGYTLAKASTDWCERASKAINNAQNKKKEIN